MRNWKEYVRERLALGGLKPAREERIVEELADQLAEFHCDAKARGASDTEAEAFAQNQVKDWTCFESDIRRAERPNTKPRIDQWHDRAAEAGHRQNGQGGLFTMFTDLQQDVLYGLRMLRRNPGFTAVAVLTLALGIGANTAIFSVVNAVILKPLPYEDPSQLVFLNEHSATETPRVFSVSLPALRDWTERNRVFDSIGAYRGTSFTMTGRGDAALLDGRMVTASFFGTLGVQPVLGRGFISDDDHPGAEPRVILSHGMWSNRFDASPDVLGQSITLNGRPYAVVGVMPPDYRFRGVAVRLWVPMGLFFDQLDSNNRGSHPGMWAVARKKPGVSLQQARADLDRIAREIEQEAGFKGGVTVTPLTDRIVGSTRPALLALLGAVGLVLLIACANVASLLLARATGRAREISLRAALGASRSRLIRQLLTESGLVACLGGVAGLLAGIWGLRLIVTLMPPNTPRLNEVEFDVWVLLFSAGLSILTGVIFGLVPALQSSRTDLTAALKEGGRGQSSASQHLRNILVVSEIALSLMLLIGAGLMVRSFLGLLKIDPGFQTTNRVAIRFSLPRTQYDTHEKGLAFYQPLLEKVRALPGVKTVALANGLPLVAPGVEVGIWPEHLVGQRDKYSIASFQFVSSGYFKTMGLQLAKGRFLDEQDREGAQEVVVVDERLAERLFPGENPLGKRIVNDSNEDGPIFLEIVGVVRHIRNYQLSSEQYIEVFKSWRQPPTWMSRMPGMKLFIHSSGDPSAHIAAVRSFVREIDPEIPIAGIWAMPDVIEQDTASQRLYLLLFGFFAAFALLLAGIGVFGIVSYSVAQRTQEIGIRMAMGAQSGDVLRLVVRQGLVLTILGIVIGVAGAFATTRVLSSLLIGVSTTDSTTFVAVPLILGIVALLACYIPARRATKVDPMVALRYE